MGYFGGTFDARRGKNPVNNYRANTYPVAGRPKGNLILDQGTKKPRLVTVAGKFRTDYSDPECSIFFWFRTAFNCQLGFDRIQGGIFVLGTNRVVSGLVTLLFKENGKFSLPS